MDLSFHPLSLDALDQVTVESLCLFIASDQRPLTGLAGLADWRLSGKLSRLLRAGLVSGESGEAVLTPPGPRMAFEKMFLFGLGQSEQGEETLVAQIAAALHKVGQAGVRTAALQLPARLGPEAAVKILVAELKGPTRALVFSPEPQKLAVVHAQMTGGRPPPPVKEPTAVRHRTPTPPPMPRAEEKPGAPGPQRYVPAAPKQNIFQKGKKKP
jgi:hypothetical protein